jgi:hypothetical protein
VRSGQVSSADRRLRIWGVLVYEAVDALEALRLPDADSFHGKSPSHIGVFLRVYLYDTLGARIVTDG